MSKEIMLKNLETGEVKPVTEERWKRIQANGFASNFKVVEPQPVPVEVAAKMKAGKAEQKEQPAEDAEATN